MKLLLLAALAIFVIADAHDTVCETLSVRGKLHKKEVLASGLNRPYQLSIYRDEHTIFFSYNVGKDEQDTFEIGYIKKGEPNVTTIKQVANGFASAVDQKNHHVYLGGSEGIYRYHLREKDGALKKIISGHDIWYIFFHEHLYFIEFPSQKLYKYETNQTSPVHQTHITEKIYQFVIDANGDQFITTDDGLYRIKQGSHDRQRYSHIKPFRGVTLDNKRHAYFCGNHSIYATNKNTHTLEEVARVRNVFGIAFDGQNNIIYSDPKKIVKLLPGDCK